MSTRVRYVDVVKGFAISAVVMMHIAYDYPKTCLIDIRAFFGYFWHVPVFFVVAGFFIKDYKLEHPWNFIKGKLKVLYRPALCIYLIAALLHNTLFSIGWYSSNISYGGKIISEWGGVDYIKNIALVVGCAGREPIVGAMWFVYVLLFSLVGFSIISFLCKKCTKSENTYEGLRFLLFTLLQFGSCLLTKKFDFTIPRCSNVFSAMLLIYIGQQIFQKWKWKFDNGYVAFVCTVFVYQGTLLMGNGSVSFNDNDYNDMMQLTIGSVAALYVLSYLGKVIENNVLGKCISFLGTESFYIMCLHVVGFHLCTELLNSLNIMDGGRSAGMTPRLDDFMIVTLYFVFGIVTPLIIMSLWRKVYRNIVGINQ